MAFKEFVGTLHLSHCVGGNKFVKIQTHLVVLSFTHPNLVRHSQQLQAKEF